MAEELKPCPLCGSDMEYREAHVAGEANWIVHAPRKGGVNCPLNEISDFNLEGDLRQAWNTRNTKEVS